MDTNQTYTVFASFDRIASGSLRVVAEAAKRHFDEHPNDTILVYDDETGRQRDFDLSGTFDEFVARELDARETRGRGRPRLGVECGELCLLPRHWDWLTAQSRSASATIRRLIDAARASESAHDRLRARIVATDKFLWSMAGDLPDYEEASRALYAEEWERFAELSHAWPAAVRDYAQEILGRGADE